MKGQRAGDQAEHRHEQREWSHPRRAVFADQGRPHAEAQHGVRQPHEQHRTPEPPARVPQGVRHVVRAAGQHGQQGQGNGRNQGAPYDQAEHVHVSRRPHDQVADRPAERRHQRDQQRHQGNVCARQRPNDGHAAKRQGHAGGLPRLNPLPEDARGQQSCKKGLRLHEQAAHPGTHAQLNGEVQQPELHHAHRQAVPPQQPHGHGGARHEKDRRDRRHQKAQGRDQQRGHVMHGPLDHHEVHAPDTGDEQGQQQAPGGQGSRGGGKGHVPASVGSEGRGRAGRSRRPNSRHRKCIFNYLSA